MTYEYFLGEVRQELVAKGMSDVGIAHFITKHDAALNFRFDQADSAAAAVKAVTKDAE